MFRVFGILDDPSPPVPPPAPPGDGIGREIAKAMLMAAAAAVGTKMVEWGLEAAREWMKGRKEGGQP